MVYAFIKFKSYFFIQFKYLTLPYTLSYIINSKVITIIFNYINNI